MQTILKDKNIIFLFSISVILYVIVVFTGLTNFYGLTGKIILSYTETGEPILGGVNTLKGMILGLGLLTTLNTILGYYMYFRIKILSYILISLNILISLFGIWLIYLLNSFN